RCRTAGATSLWFSRSPAARRSALRELGPLAGLLETGLLALLDARIARQEAASLQLPAEMRVGDDQRTGDPVSQRAGLGGDTTAVHPRDHVHPALIGDRLERLADDALQCLAGEELLERLAVDHVRSRARLEDHARDRGLALARRRVARAGSQVDR